MSAWIDPNGVRFPEGPFKPLTQRQRVMLLLASGEWVHQRELNAICFRYSARIFELRRAGFAVEMQRAPDGSVFYRHVK